MADFFISYTFADRAWAEWVGYVLEEDGFAVIIQAWDFRPGSNFMLEMQRASTEADRTIMLLSPDYLKSQFASPEWAAALAQDPQGLKRKLVPVIVRECQVPGLLTALVHISLVDENEGTARTLLINGLKNERAKPSERPNFPGALAGGPPKPFPGGQSAVLTYRTMTEVDDDSTSAVLKASLPNEIVYHNDIRTKVALLQSYDSDPQPFLEKLPRMRKLVDPREREEEAAWYHSEIHETPTAVQKVIIEGKNDLVSLVSRLRADRVDEDLAKRSLKAFGSFAALRLIRQLKKFYDVEDGKPETFFENYAFNKDPSYCYLDWAPRKSPTGKRVFGYYYYVGARVGPNWDHYEYVMLPLDMARTLFTGDVRGDAEAFYLWVLPQLYLVGCYHGIDKFQAHGWRVLLLKGAGIEEWQGPWHEDPWKGMYG
jgi:hypothetical protein